MGGKELNFPWGFSFTLPSIGFIVCCTLILLAHGFINGDFLGIESRLSGLVFYFEDECNDKSCRIISTV